MKTKATISINPDTLAEAKKLAKRRKTSFSRLIEGLLSEAVISTEDPVKNLIGSAELNESLSDDPLYRKLTEKYIRG
jgi:predicted CopG family antitoxin